MNSHKLGASLNPKALASTLKVATLVNRLVAGGASRSSLPFSTNTSR